MSALDTEDDEAIILLGCCKEYTAHILVLHVPYISQYSITEEESNCIGFNSEIVLEEEREGCIMQMEGASLRVWCEGGTDLFMNLSEICRGQRLHFQRER